MCVSSVSRTDAFAKGRSELRMVLLDKDGMATVRNTLITEVVHCVSLEHDGHPWQHSAEDGATMSHSLLAENTGVNLHGVLLRVFAGSCVEQIFRPFGRVFRGQLAKFNSTVLRLLSCEQRRCQLLVYEPTSLRTSRTHERLIPFGHVAVSTSLGVQCDGLRLRTLQKHRRQQRGVNSAPRVAPLQLPP